MIALLLYFGILDRFLHRLLPVDLLIAHFISHLICSLYLWLVNLWILFLLLHVSLIGIFKVPRLIIKNERFFLLKLGGFYRFPHHITSLGLSCWLNIWSCVLRFVQKLVPFTGFEVLSLLHKPLLQVTRLILVLLLILRWLTLIALGFFSFRVLLISSLINLLLLVAPQIHIAR